MFIWCILLCLVESQMLSETFKVYSRTIFLMSNFPSFGISSFCLGLLIAFFPRYEICFFPILKVIIFFLYFLYRYLQCFFVNMAFNKHDADLYCIVFLYFVVWQGIDFLLPLSTQRKWPHFSNKEESKWKYT